MAYYLVRANPKPNTLTDLKARLESGEIKKMRPFGKALFASLTSARVVDNGTAIWEENDYCNPPLTMERAAVLDDYFTDITVEEVSKGEGWKKLEALPLMWEVLT